VVCGDLIVLAEGDRVPADAVFVESHDLQADESLLTGESVPVRNAARPDAVPSESHRPGGNNLPWVFSGSLVVRGTGTGAVTATGARKPSLTDLTIVAFHSGAAGNDQNLGSDAIRSPAFG
jgi:P-type Ca2+ transporter type 2C